ncbi:class I SAM-dependent methyltransferase [Yersinia bercovieri]|uniref:class I SAM-dependent methyltransferase n=1 Tax=Yersinia bercovieri TaxID=634 RepID=UPI0005DB214B|nr:class I SAM-dependent methyltransferase [Yersinia bercovieri]CFQ31115.1 bifunctional 3-demethylubiquinone-9 3-methyltransferase/ 2-octaprenyl-6-hydroxy phenol methylase [Yersinia bercovieri]
MSIKISGGVKEDGIVTGNAYDKYGSANPIVKIMMKGFESALLDFVAKVNPINIHEIGCGEGHWVLRWNEQRIKVRGSDFSNHVIELAGENAKKTGVTDDLFEVKSIYDLDEKNDTADLIVCCEVLEHLEDPKAALQVLQKIVGRHIIVSVPREPLWCALNLTRGKYIRNWGNTPGHLQHWSKKSFIKLISKYFDIIEIKSPLPWTMLLCKPLVNN